MVSQHNKPEDGAGLSPPIAGDPSGQSPSVESTLLHLSADDIPYSTLRLTDHKVSQLSGYIRNEITRRTDHARAYLGFCQKNFSPMADEERQEISRGFSGIFPGFRNVEVRAASSDPAHTVFHGRERELISIERGIGGKPKIVLDQALVVFSDVRFAHKEVRSIVADRIATFIRDEIFLGKVACNLHKFAIYPVIKALSWAELAWPLENDARENFRGLLAKALEIGPLGHIDESVFIRAVPLKKIQANCGQDNMDIAYSLGQDPALQPRAETAPAGLRNTLHQISQKYVPFIANFFEEPLPIQMSPTGIALNVEATHTALLLSQHGARPEVIRAALIQHLSLEKNELLGMHFSNARERHLVLGYKEALEELLRSNPFSPPMPGTAIRLKSAGEAKENVTKSEVDNNASGPQRKFDGTANAEMKRFINLVGELADKHGVDEGGLYLLHQARALTRVSSVTSNADHAFLVGFENKIRLIYAPLAERLGQAELNTSLRISVERAVHPERFSDTVRSYREALDMSHAEQQKLVTTVRDVVEDRIKKGLIHKGLDPNLVTVTFRLKDYESFGAKKGKFNDLNGIMIIVGEDTGENTVPDKISPETRQAYATIRGLLPRLLDGIEINLPSGERHQLAPRKVDQRHHAHNNQESWNVVDFEFKAPPGKRQNIGLEVQLLTREYYEGPYKRGKSGDRGKSHWAMKDTRQYNSYFAVNGSLDAEQIAQLPDQIFDRDDPNFRGDAAQRFRTLLTVPSIERAVCPKFLHGVIELREAEKGIPANEYNAALLRKYTREKKEWRVEEFPVGATSLALLLSTDVELDPRRYQVCKLVHNVQSRDKDSVERLEPLDLTEKLNNIDQYVICERREDLVGIDRSKLAARFGVRDDSEGAKVALGLRGYMLLSRLPVVHDEITADSRSDLADEFDLAIDFENEPSEGDELGDFDGSILSDLRQEGCDILVGDYGIDSMSQDEALRSGLRKSSIDLIDPELLGALVFHFKLKNAPELEEAIGNGHVTRAALSSYYSNNFVTFSVEHNLADDTFHIAVNDAQCGTFASEMRKAAREGLTLLSATQAENRETMSIKFAQGGNVERFERQVRNTIHSPLGRNAPIEGGYLTKVSFELHSKSVTDVPGDLAEFCDYVAGKGMNIEAIEVAAPGPGSPDQPYLVEVTLSGPLSYFDRSSTKAQKMVRREMRRDLGSEALTEELRNQRDAIRLRVLESVPEEERVAKAKSIKDWSLSRSVNGKFGSIDVIALQNK